MALDNIARERERRRRRGLRDRNTADNDFPPEEYRISVRRDGTWRPSEWRYNSEDPNVHRKVMKQYHDLLRQYDESDVRIRVYYENGDFKSRYAIGPDKHAVTSSGSMSSGDTGSIWPWVIGGIVVIGGIYLFTPKAPT